MATRIKLRRDTTQNWMTVNPILANGEVGIEADTRRVKLGDGATAWNDLKYAITDQLKIDGKTINTEMGVGIASQDPETWISSVKAKGNWAGTDGVAYDSMGNLYLSGWEEFGWNQLDMGSGKSFLIKYDSKGTVLWSKYTALNGYSIGAGVTVDSEDNVVVSSVDWDNGFFVITKYTESGDVVWQKSYIDSYDYAKGYVLAVDSNDNIVVAGTRGDQNHDGSTAVYAMKIMGTDGSVIWTKTMGRWYTDIWQPSLAIDGGNNIIVGGMDSHGSDGQANITKLSTDGTLIWNKTLRNPSAGFGGYELDLGSLDADEDGNIYFAGSYIIPKFVTDLANNTWDGRAGLIVKMNGEGVVQWSRMVGPGDCEDMGAQVVYKSGKLYATFQTERPYYKNDFVRNAMYGYTTQEIVLACYDVNNGKVLWQNNFGPEVLWGYTNPTGTPNNYQDTSNYSGRLIAVHGDYVAMAGQAGEYSRADDNETRSYGFVAQLPADGTEMDLEGWEYKTSNHKGLYAKVQVEDFSNYSVNNTTNISAVTTNFTSVDTADNVRIDLLAAGANQWDFKPNGDLALPVGGNIEISRATQGSINAVGFFDSHNPYGIYNYFNAVTTDADGNRYYVGQWNAHNNNNYDGNSSLPLVVKVNAQGQVEWKSRLSNAIIYRNNSVYGEARAVAYDPASGHIVVVATDSGEGNAEQMLIVDMNPVTGDVVESHRYYGSDDIRANGITINTLGERFVTGVVQGSNYVGFTVTNAMLASTTTVDTLMVPTSVFAGHVEPSYLGGTGGWSLFDNANLSAIDYYTGATGTVRQGRGANFDITADGAGGYTIVLGSEAGTNYRVGHKILVLGSLLGGVDSTNNAIITVDALVDSGIGNIASASIYGTSTGSATYTAQTGTNYNVGSGFTIDVQVDNSTSTNNLIVYHNAGGTNYVVGDVITFPGTQFGGTSTATDIVITALAVGGYTGDVYSGEDSGYHVTQRGVSPLTYVRLQFNGMDFTPPNVTYTLQHYTDANAFLGKFVSTATTSTSVVWNKWIEKSNYDEGVAVDYDSEGNLYWASRIYDEYEVGTDENYQYRPVVTKLSSTGTSIWSKSYSLDVRQSEPTGLQVDSEDYVVLGFNKWDPSNDQYDPVVKRLTGDGDSLWTRRYFLDGGEGNGGGLALDNDDNIYFTTDNYNNEDYVSWTVKLDIQLGREIWQQEISNERQDIYHGWNDYSNAIAVDDKQYHVGKYTFSLDGNEGNAIAMSLPSDGSAEGTQQGPFAIDQAFYNNEGGTGNNGGDAPVVRNYVVSNTSFGEITANYADGGRDPIRSWLVTDPITYYPVVTKSEAGIVFGDGTVQTTSGQGIPQVKHNRYGKQIKLKLDDAGKHLYMKNSNQTIVVPTYSEVQFPVGTVITIVNINGGWVYIGADIDNGRTQLYCPALDGNEGSGSYVAGWQFHDNGGGNLITLLKVEESYSNGSRWVISGNNGQRWN